MNWTNAEGREFFEGDRMIAAVPVRSIQDPGTPERPHYYWDIALVTVDHDGSLWLDDSDCAMASDWGWNADAIGWFIPIDELRGELPMPCPLCDHDGNEPNEETIEALRAAEERRES